MNEKKPTLAQLGQVYVTMKAAQEYQREVECDGYESARRDLTLLLLGAHVTGNQDINSDGRVNVRTKSLSTDLDITAGVRREGPLLVVLGITVRNAYRRNTTRPR